MGGHNYEREEINKLRNSLNKLWDAKYSKEYGGGGMKNWWYESPDLEEKLHLKDKKNIPSTKWVYKNCSF